MWIRLQVAWGRENVGVASFLAGEWDSVGEQGVYQYVSRNVPDFLNILAAGLVTVGFVPIVRRFGAAPAALLVLNLVPSLASGGWLSVGRATAVLFPTFLWLADAIPAAASPDLVRRLRGPAGVRRDAVLHLAAAVLIGRGAVRARPRVRPHRLYGDVKRSRILSARPSMPRAYSAIAGRRFALLGGLALLAGLTAGPTLRAQAGRTAVERALMTGRYDEVHTLATPLGDDPAAAVLRARAYVAVGEVRRGGEGAAAGGVGESDRRRGRRAGHPAAAAGAARRGDAHDVAHPVARDRRGVGRRLRPRRPRRAGHRTLPAGQRFLPRGGQPRAHRRERQHRLGRAVPREARTARGGAIVRGGAARRRQSPGGAAGHGPHRARGQPAGGPQAGAADARREPQRGRRPRAAGADRPRRPEARRRQGRDREGAGDQSEPPGGAVAVGGAGLAREARHRPDGGHRGGAQDQPALRRGAPGDRRRVGARTTASTRPPSSPARPRARPRELPGLRRPRRAPDAGRRRARGAAGARDRLPRSIPTTSSPTTCSACSTPSTASR